LLFGQAHLEKAKVQVKEGSFAAARASLQAYLRSKPTDVTATDLVRASAP
jgi:predicted negative regulator of RcsB-dependent stress response